MHIFCVSLDRRKGDLLPTHHMFTRILILRILSYKKSSVSFHLLKMGFCFVCNQNEQKLPIQAFISTRKVKKIHEKNNGAG